MSQSVNLKDRVYITAAGENVPIVRLLDSDGDECMEDKAVVAVAGPDSFDHWYSIDLESFKKATVH